MKPYRHALLLLRRELRLDDNTALLEACRNSDQVSLGFILDPRQIQSHRWRSLPGMAFMLESLRLMHDELAGRGGGIHFIKAEAAEGLTTLLKRTGCDAVFANRDYTPFALKRDAELGDSCKATGIPLHLSDDVLLHKPGSILTAEGKPYQVFTPFYRRALASPVPAPLAFNDWDTLHPMPPEEQIAGRALLEELHIIASPITAGRGGAMAIVQQLPCFTAYAQQRDIPALDASTHLSTHLKFGTLSAREAWHGIASLLDADHPLLRQLVWRDFFSHIGWHYPHVFGQAFHRKFNSIAWSQDESRFAAWCEGKTGFPIVDAGMRELAASGFMHNRVRMITASFLVKDLHIDWRRGEAWFARHLVDYDPAVNNGNWQWAASTGCDAQPWFRIFNPWLQQKRFDADAVYIKRWLPGLSSSSSAAIMDWAKLGNAQKHPLPIVDHRQQSAQAKEMYRLAATGESDE